MIVIPLGVIVSFVVYLIGFLGISYLLERISNEIAKILPFMHFESFGYIVLVIFIYCMIIAFSFDQNKRKVIKDKEYIRKDWQKLLEILGLVLISYFLFNQNFRLRIVNIKMNIIIYFIVLTSLYIIAFSYFFTVGVSNNFDRVCCLLVEFIEKICLLYCSLIMISVFFSILYLHDFVITRNIVLSGIYFFLLILVTLFSSYKIYKDIYDSSEKKVKEILVILMNNIILIVCIGVSPVLNIFVNNKSMISLYPVLIVNSGILLIFMIVSTIIKIIKTRT